MEIFEKNPKLALLLTQYGGHIGFTEGFIIKSRSIVENAMMQFAKVLGIPNSTATTTKTEENSNEV